MRAITDGHPWSAPLRQLTLVGADQEFHKSSDQVPRCIVTSPLPPLPETEDKYFWFPGQNSPSNYLIIKHCHHLGQELRNIDPRGNELSTKIVSWSRTQHSPNIS